MANQIRGRFQKDAAKTALAYSSSIHYDWRLYPYDIAGSIAHAKMLAKQSIITQQEAEAIVLKELGVTGSLSSCQTGRPHAVGTHWLWTCSNSAGGRPPASQPRF